MARWAGVIAGLLAAATGASAAYDASRALALAYVSSASYCDASCVTAWNCAASASSGISLTHVSYLTESSLELVGFTGADLSGNAYVAFRGSSNIPNWIDDFNFTSVSFPGISGALVHGGFYESWVLMAPQVIGALDKMGGLSVPSVTMTGHSLGAAITQIGTFELALAGYPVTEMYNFGQPRTGNDVYSANFESFVIKGNDGGAAVKLFNNDMLEAHMATGAFMPVSHALVAAVDRALAHPGNRALRISANARAEIVRVLKSHAMAAVAAVRAGGLATLAGKRAPLALSAAHATILRGLLAFTGAPIKTSGLKGFTGAQAYRVTHNADPVPHLPPESFGFEHAIEEIFYNEPSTSFTQCSLTNGEDPNCADGVALPIDVADHLDYLAIKIDGDC